MDDTDLVYKVNQMLRRSGVRDSVSSLSQCTSEIFLILYEILTGSVINCDDVASELEKCSVIVHCLQAFLDVDLSHIEGSALACRQVETIRDLLNVFVELCASREGEGVGSYGQLYLAGYRSASRGYNVFLIRSL